MQPYPPALPQQLREWPNPAAVVDGTPEHHLERVLHALVQASPRRLSYSGGPVLDLRTLQSETGLSSVQLKRALVVLRHLGHVRLGHRRGVRGRPALITCLNVEPYCHAIRLHDDDSLQDTARA